MKKNIKILTIFIVSFSVLLTTSSLYVYQIFRNPNILINQPIVKFTIPYKSNFKDIQFDINKNKYISNLLSFSFLSKLLSLDQKITPGIYKLETNMNNWDIIKLFKNGIQNLIKIKIYKKKKNFSLKITKSVGISSLRFIYNLNSKKIYKQYGFNIKNIKFIFIPNIYKIYWTIGEKELFNFIYKQYNKFWNKKRIFKLNQLSLNLLEISIKK